MMFLNKKILIFSLSIIISVFISQAYSEVVCSEDELVKELVEDIEENG